MYKILIVDDEKWIRKGIAAKLEDSGLTFSWIREASDGEDAWECIRTEEPDIIITDIKMPNLDGLQLIKSMRELYPDIHFIIISGYAEFEYAEQAVNMGVCGYILKPISDENLIKVMHGAIKKLQQKREVKEIIGLKENLQKDNEALLHERFLNQMLNTNSSKEDEDTVIAKLFGDKQNEFCALVMLHIDSSNYIKSNFRYQDLELIKFSIKNILSELFKDAIIINNQGDLNQIYALLFHPRKERLSELSSQFAMDAYTKVSKYLNISLTVAVSGIAQNVTYELSKQVKAAFDLRLIYGSNKIYRYDNISLSQKFDLPEHKLILLRKCMESYDCSNILALLNDLFSYENLKSYSGVYCRYMFSEIINILLKVCTNSGIDVEASIDSDLLTGKVLDNFESSAEVVSYLYTSIVDALKVEPVSSFDCKNIINKAIDFINHNYYMDLNIKELARKFAFNSNYFTTVFKQLTGQTFTKYLTDIRIKKACELLRSTELGMSEIAESIGYTDVQYFYRVFKKVTGKTTAEFRQSIGT